MRPDCRKAKKAAWRREKMHSDEQFRLDQQLSNQKWLKAKPGYWKGYRIDHPDKTQRNRELQIVRNGSRRRAGKEVIAKIDASKPNKFNPVGRYYLIPMIAKIDALKVRIYEVTAPYG